MDLKTSIKSMGIRFWIPIFINDILIPLAILYIKRVGNYDNLEQGINTLTQMFTPFLASFWIFLQLSKYVDEDGNEIFFINERVKLYEVIKLYVFYIATNTVFFLWYCRMGQNFFLEWIHIVIISFLFVAASYFFVFLFYSISLAIIPLFFYLIASIIGLNETLSKISYYEVFGVSIKSLQNRYSYFAIASLVFLISGMIINKYREKYK